MILIMQIPKKNYLARKPLNAYKENVRDLWTLVNFDNGKIRLSGSVVQPVQPFAGDYDIHYNLDYKKPMDQLKKHLARNFRSIIGRLKRRKDIFVMEFRGGIDDDLFISPKAPTKEIKAFYNNKSDLIDDDLLEKLKISSKTNNREEVREIARKIYTLKWSTDEVLAGEKKLSDGTVKKFEDIFDDGLIIKFDIIALVDSRFEDMENIYEIRNYGKILSGDRGNIEEELKQDIIDLWNDDKYFKFLKRVFTVAKVKKDWPTIKKIVPIFNSNAGLVYKASTDLKTLVKLIDAKDKSKLKPYYKDIQDFIQIVKYSLSNVFEFDLEKNIFGLMDEITKIKDLDKMGEELENLREYLYNKANSVTKNLIKKTKINVKKYLN